MQLGTWRCQRTASDRSWRTCGLTDVSHQQMNYRKTSSSFVARHQLWRLDGLLASNCWFPPEGNTPSSREARDPEHSHRGLPNLHLPGQRRNKKFQERQSDKNNESEFSLMKKHKRYSHRVRNKVCSWKPAPHDPPSSFPIC
ncbi:uncharacterized protein LOC143677591 [Tamandua tetradactyla]|uniref:uncharacterized protein LOC143677591 n=1 Tax=Tamandua tetradactyla TaxID=48850 RepID=UPI0040544618